MWLPVLVLRR